MMGSERLPNLYSLIETAKANGLEPHAVLSSAYLTKIFTCLPNAKTLEEIEALLPWLEKASDQEP